MPTTKPTAKTTPQTPPVDLVKLRTEGSALIRPLQGRIVDITITDTQTYLEADAFLGEIVTARRLWTAKLEPVRTPQQRAIDAAKVALAEAKKAAAALDGFHDEYDRQLVALETRIKNAMRDFKLLEARQAREEQERKDREEAEARRQAEEAARQAQAARTPKLKARLEQRAADLAQRAEEIQQPEPVAPRPTGGMASTARRMRFPVVVNPEAFLAAAQTYRPAADLYREGHPPIVMVDRRGVEKPLIEIHLSRLEELWREQPGIVETWPGVKIEEDFNIARR